MSAALSRHLWTIVLAGGDGVRLRQLTRAVHGEDCPKQFALLSGNRSLIQSTVARAARWSVPERTVVVVAAEREALARRQLREFGAVDVVTQPSNRGTGPGIFLPLARVFARDPLARVVILPSDHYVRDEESFEQSIRTAVEEAADHVALVGAVPDHPETQYGWIVPGSDRRNISSKSKPSHVVTSFCEKPPMPLAEQLFRSGALWNTFIMAGSAKHFWSLGRRHLPFQMALFETYRRSLGSAAEPNVLNDIYLRLPAADFSSDVLQKADGLRVARLRECGWSDWGTPERVLESLRDHSDYEVLSTRLAEAGGSCSAA
jgi:mannose-1-phosphate guanylyltransferase